MLEASGEPFPSARASPPSSVSATFSLAKEIVSRIHDTGLRQTSTITGRIERRKTPAERKIERDVAFLKDRVSFDLYDESIYNRW